ncbi:helix-turn-helix domain-containing protein [Gottfriedia luciferensis]|uniref:helix-turn-helix domain-containing protein n=1 Tax=Gottfriedia luciferensis TaxID=178774 RepID=UPI000B43A1CD|nr:helix-turn-helix transcriptional regulator [Gottfriedia luciferensis]
MLEGEIIKFYRKKAGLTQEDLGKDICTATHVSRIERGETRYSAEIIKLFSQRLQIDIEKEITAVKNIEIKLQKWHNSIILERMNEVTKIKEELENIQYINASNYAIYYQLLLARYFILRKNIDKTERILKRIEKESPPMSTYEKNLYYHVRGIYYLDQYTRLNNVNRQSALQELKKINIEEYGNREYYYHLGVAYHWTQSKVMAYFYGEKAFRYFKKTNNYARAILAESLMLVQLKESTQLDFEEIVVRYESLIELSESLGLLDKRGMILHNLGLMYFWKQDFKNAHVYYDKSVKEADKQSLPYLNRLYNYLDNAEEGKLLSTNELLKQANEGLALSEKATNDLYKILFNLLIFRFNNQFDEYYLYIDQTALPFFKSHHHVTHANKYAKLLYNYYVKTEQFKKAVQTGDMFINKP